MDILELLSATEIVCGLLFVILCDCFRARTVQLDRIPEADCLAGVAWDSVDVILLLNVLGLVLLDH